MCFQRLDVALNKIGEKSLFTKELEVRNLFFIAQILFLEETLISPDLP